MATSKETMAYILDQIRGLPNIRARKMFGEYALYCEEKVVALVCDDQLFVKITPDGKQLVGERYAEGQPYPGARPAMLIDPADLDDGERLRELILLTAAALPLPKAKAAKRRLSK